MDDNNILTGGVDKLTEIKEDFKELKDKKMKYNSLTKNVDDLDKRIQELDKAIQDEILDTTNNRRKKIETTFNKQIDKTRNNIKKISDKRDKVKSSKVSERIEVETKLYEEENKELRQDIKKKFKQDRIPALCNTKMFFALYFPRGFSDLLIILLTVLIVFLAIPSSIYFFLLSQDDVLYLIITYFATIVIFGGLYFLIGSRTKERKRDTFIEVKEIKNKIKSNKKRIARIKKRIVRDNDESPYGLEEFDNEINELEQEAADIGEKKKEALLQFDNTTKKVITKQIQDRLAGKKAELEANYDKASYELSRLDKQIKGLTIKIASEYEPYIGKDLMTIDRLDALINIIEAENATNISEAIAFHKEHMH